MTELEKARLLAARSEIVSLADAAMDGSLTEEALGAGLEALRQIPLGVSRVVDAVHVPADAGEYREGLERILERIPSGWGRWIDCGPGWYPIVVRLSDALAELIPGFEVHQVKEKYGTLRFYWGVPYEELPCCTAFRVRDPRPAQGAISGPYAPKDRDPEELRLLEEWFARYLEHQASSGHRRENELASAAVDQDRAMEIGERAQALVSEAEEASARTCETCGASGVLHEDGGWLRTLCAGCAEGSGFVACA